MKHIGFVRPVRLGSGRHGALAHHEVLEMPARLTPRQMGFAVSVPQRLTGLAFGPCAHCSDRAYRTMTVCASCGGTGRVVL